MKRKLKKLFCFLLVAMIIMSLSCISASAVTVSATGYRLYNPFSGYCIDNHISEEDLPLARWKDFTLEGTGVTIYQSSLYSETVMLKNKYDRNLDRLCENISQMNEKNVAKTAPFF